MQCVYTCVGRKRPWNTLSHLLSHSRHRMSFWVSKYSNYRSCSNAVTWWRSLEFSDTSELLRKRGTLWEILTYQHSKHSSEMFKTSIWFSTSTTVPSCSLWCEASRKMEIPLSQSKNLFFWFIPLYFQMWSS